MKDRLISEKLAKLIRNLPWCSRCSQALITTCDRNKPSELTEYKGIEWTEKHHQFMMLYPMTQGQNKLCSYCEDKLHPPKIGKES